MFPENSYAAWRTSASGGTSAFREEHLSVPPERLLQAIWQHQRLLRDQLRTLDGQSLRILHPGFKNHEAGPDFHGAVLQLGGEPPRSGDVEIDLNAAGWRLHGHDRNPNYQNVILHVVWDGEHPSSANLPVTLALGRFLDAPLDELNLALRGEAGETLLERLHGRCSAPLRALPSGHLNEMLHQAALVRLQNKAGWFQARARQSGWEQALWEGLFRALGYKQNVWPMQRLAELRERWRAGNRPLPPLAWQARLFGLAGLLPTELPRAQPGAARYLRRIWDVWWHERDEFSDCILPRAGWRFHGLRPANHPQRRLALAAHWLAAENLPAKLQSWCVEEISATSAGWPDSLRKILQVERDDFWSWHWTIRSARMAKPLPLLGTMRVTDLAINVILPWLWARAKEGGNEALLREVERRYLAWPPADDNSPLRLARQRMLSGASRSLLKRAARQQGLLQIVQDFCDRSNAVCDNCRFPEWVRAWET